MVVSSSGDRTSGVDPIEYAWIIPYVIKSYGIRSIYLDHDDLVGYGWVGMMKAVARFDPKKGKSFVKYAKYWIFEEIEAAIYNFSSPIRIPIYLKKGGVRWFGRECFSRVMYRIKCPGRVEWDISGWLDSALSGLSCEDREIVESYYGLGGRRGGMKLCQIAESRCRSKDWARVRLNRSLAILRSRVAHWEDTGRWPV